MCEDTGIIEEDFDYLLSFLPTGWEAKAKELGALRRARKIPDPPTLLRILLIHLAEGCSLRETALRARRGGLAEISDVAVMGRLKLSGDWWRWMNQQLMGQWIAQQPSTVFGSKWNVRVVDGTRIKEPGPTGSSWCVHYVIGLPSLQCSELIVDGYRGVGESFKLFSVKKGDLFMGDRAYGVRSSIFHVVENGGDTVVRFALSNLPLKTEGGRSFNLLRHLRQLRGTQMGDWPVVVERDGHKVKGRVCAIKKSRQATEKARAKVQRQAQKGSTATRQKTLEAAGYTFVFTTVASEDLCVSKVLEMYRGRWQIELVFKRLKSIMGIGHLHKIDKDAAFSWIQGKLFVALLIEALIRQGESFFPWGYPIHAMEGS